MQLSDVFNSQAVAMNRTEVMSNRIPFLGEALFPARKKMGIDLKWIKTHKGLGVALKPSNFDAIPTVRPRGQANMTKEEMPLFRESRIVKEHDMMEISRIQDSNDPYLQPVLDSIYDDTNDLLDGADISTEWMRMQLLAPLKGEMKIVIPMADNTTCVYNYDEGSTWKDGHYAEIKGNAQWKNGATAKPLTDIRKGIQVLANLGITATAVIANSTTYDHLLECEQVKNAFLTITGQTIDFMDESALDEVFRRKLKLDRIVYDKMFTDYAGAQQKFFPDNYVTIIGSGQLGNTWYGTTPEELTAIGFMNVPQPPVDITVMDNGVAIAVQGEYKPSFTFTTTASQIVLPSYEGMDGVYVMNVEAGEGD